MNSSVYHSIHSRQPKDTRGYATLLGMELKDRIAYAIAEARRLNPELDKTSLAKKMGVGRQVLYNWMEGKVASPRSKSLYKLAEAAHLNPEWLLREKGPERPVQELSEDEQVLVDRFRRLTEENRIHVLGYLAFVRSTQMTGNPTRRAEFESSLSLLHEPQPEYDAQANDDDLIKND